MARMSPWVIAGVGCAGVMALGVIGIGGVVFGVSKVMKEELEKPVDKTATLAALKVPLYPGAEFDEKLTRSLRTGTTMAQKFTKLDMAMAGFLVRSSPDEVFAWYAKNLSEQGYKQQESSQEKPSAKQLVFVKGTDLVMIGVPETGHLTVMRMKTPGNN
jgi:hypothetical protein